MSTRVDTWGASGIERTSAIVRVSLFECLLATPRDATWLLSDVSVRMVTFRSAHPRIRASARSVACGSSQRRVGSLQTVVARRVEAVSAQAARLVTNSATPTCACGASLPRTCDDAPHPAGFRDRVPSCFRNLRSSTGIEKERWRCHLRGLFHTTEAVLAAAACSRTDCAARHARVTKQSRYRCLDVGAKGPA